MNFLRSLFLVVGLLCVLLAIRLFLGNNSQGFSPSRGTEGPRESLWETYSSLESEARRGDVLDADSRMIFDATRAKDRIADGLIEGRLLFAEAMAQFRAVDANKPLHLRTSTSRVPGASVEERSAHSLFNWARTMPRVQLGGEAVLARLAKERDEYLAQLSSPQ